MRQQRKFPSYPSSKQLSTSNWAGAKEGEPPSEALLRTLASDLGYSRFLMATFPIPGNMSFLDNIRFTNWPTSLREAYHQTNAFSASKLTHSLRRSALPLFGGSELLAKCIPGPGWRTISHLFEKNGFQAFHACSLHSADREQFLFVLSKDVGSTDTPPSGDLLLRCLHVLDTYKAEQDGSSDEVVKLSLRELECLQWSAAGKSTDEIAIILDLSPHTAASYIKTAMQKLKAKTRMQAIARAIRSNLI